MTESEKLIELENEPYSQQGLGTYELGDWELGDDVTSGSPETMSVQAEESMAEQNTDGLSEVEDPEMIVDVPDHEQMSEV